MNDIKLIEGGVECDGKRITVSRGPNDKKYVINVDGKKIRVNDDKFFLLYAYFCAIHEHVKKEMEP